MREAFLKTGDCLPDAKRIFPGRVCFTSEELSFSGILPQKNRTRGGFRRRGPGAAGAPEQRKDADALRQTLAAYLLDTDAGLAETAKALYLHKNTVKYRLKSMSDRFGFRVGSMPSSAGLYEAIGVERLLRS